jgi:uncharacterized protein YlxP (DUF503 family)
MNGGYVGILAVELRFPEAGSLKDKRQYLRATKAQLQNRFGASVAETDHHDLWQRSTLVVALAGAEVRALEQLMDGAERFLRGQEYELILLSRRITKPDED